MNTNTTLSWLVVFLLVSSLCRAEIRIMPLGDSITEGGYEHRPGFPTTEGAYRTELVPKLLKIRPDILFVGSKESGPATLVQRHHEGHSGWRIDELIAGRVYARSYQKGIEAWLSAYNPDVILLMIGTNDIVQNYFLDQQAQRFQKLIDEIWRLSPHSVIFVSSLIPTNNSHLNAEIEKFNDEIHLFVMSLKNTGQSVIWVDMYNESKMSWGKGDYADGVHPSAQGNSKMAQVWFEHVASFIKTP